MSVFVGASGGIGADTGAAIPGAFAGGFGSTYSPSQPAFWSLVILAALVAAVVVIAHGAR